MRSFRLNKRKGRICALLGLQGYLFGDDNDGP